jgi:hypothetical protein
MVSVAPELMVMLLHAPLPVALICGMNGVPDGIITLSEDDGGLLLHQLLPVCQSVLVPPSQSSAVAQSSSPMAKSLKAVKPVHCVESEPCVPVVVVDHADPLYLLTTSEDVLGEPTLSPLTNVNVALYDVKPPTPVFVKDHFLLIYFD